METAKQNGNICGITAEFGCVEAADVARCLEQLLGGRMQNIFTSTLATLNQLWENVPSTAGYTELRAFDDPRWLKQVAGGNIVQKPEPNPQHTLNINTQAEETAKNDYGCLGFAVNLIHIEHNPRLLRRYVFYPLLRNTMIFKEASRMDKFAKEAGQHISYQLVSLDGKSIKSDGARVCGGGRSGGARFCQRPGEHTSFLDPRLAWIQQLKDTKRMCEQQLLRADEDKKQPEENIAREQREIEKLREELPRIARRVGELDRQIKEKTADLKELTSALEAKEADRSAASVPPAKKARRA
jgi:chromosome segregation ATPase